MADTIEVTVGDSFAQRHQNLVDQLGSEYETMMRDTVEDELHRLTKQLERISEQQQVQSEDTVDGLIDEAEAGSDE